MAYANYPQNIFDRIRALILASYSTINIINKRIVDEDGVIDSDSTAKHQMALGLWLISDEFTEEGAPQADDRVYEFEAQLVIKDIDENQNRIWDTVERIKFICESNKEDSSGNWYRLEVSSVNYSLPLSETNFKLAIMTMEFHQYYVND